MNCAYTLIILLLQRANHIQMLSSSNKDTTVLFPNSVPVTADDIATFQKQTGQIAPSKAAVGVPNSECCKCQHGYPQVFTLNPIPGTGKRMNSGLVKLTCPLLVNAIDQLEDEGYIRKFTERVELDSALQDSVRNAHMKHSSIRQSMISDPSPLLNKLGEKGAEAFLNAGIAGATAEKADVKCLHAWLGDYLFFGDENLLGSSIKETLETENGIRLRGTADCNKFCNPSNFQTEPPKPRNKQRLKTRKERDRRKRIRERSKDSSNMEDEEKECKNMESILRQKRK